MTNHDAYAQFPESYRPTQQQPITRTRLWQVLAIIGLILVATVLGSVLGLFASSTPPAPSPAPHTVRPAPGPVVPDVGPVRTVDAPTPWDDRP